MRIREALFVVAVGAPAVLALATPREALAASPEMQRVFDEGRGLARAGDYEAAAKKFLEAQAIEPSVGALLNLGDCYERLGRPASARKAFLDAMKLASADDPARAQEAKARATKLLARIAWLDFARPTSATHKIVVDGEPVAEGTERVAVDPGMHEVVVITPARERNHAIRLGPGESSAPIALDDAQAAPPTKPEAPGWSTFQWAGAATAGAGAVGVGVAVVFGIVAAGKKSDLSGSCPDYPRCPEKERGAVEPAFEDARDAATISTVAAVSGVALVAAGVTLFLLAPRTQKTVGVASSRPTPTALVLRF